MTQEELDAAFSQQQQPTQSDPKLVNIGLRIEKQLAEINRNLWWVSLLFKLFFAAVLAYMGASFLGGIVEALGHKLWDKP